jgi:hypothetical protein
MYTLISYPAGIVIEGVILSRTRDRMRVAVAGMPDALELRRTGNDWLTDSGEKVQFEFLAAESPATGGVAPPRLLVRKASSAAC